MPGFTDWQRVTGTLVRKMPGFTDSQRVTGTLVRKMTDFTDNLRVTGPLVRKMPLFTDRPHGTESQDAAYGTFKSDISGRLNVLHPI